MKKLKQLSFMPPFILLSLLTGIVATSGCANTKAVSSPTRAPITTFGASYTAPTLSAGQAAIVFFRQPNTRKTMPITVFIDSKYLGSVLPGGYITAIVCMGNHNIALAGDNTLRAVPLNVKNIEISPFTTQLYELNDNSTGIPYISARTTMDDPALIRKQTQTISRLPITDCHSVVPSQLQLTEELKLSNTELLNASQRDQLNKILNNWQSQLTEINTIEIIAPPSTGYDDKIIKAQSTAVKDYYSTVLPSKTRVIIKHEAIDSNTCPYTTSDKCQKIIKIITSGQAR